MIAAIRTALRSLTLLGWAVIIGLILLFVLLATCSHYTGKEAKRDQRAAEERAQTLDDAIKASDKASGERLTDIQINIDREKELTDAVSSLPDAAPSLRRITLACQRLLQQGTRDADLPASCRSGG